MIKKFFIKDYQNVNDKNVRNKYGIVAGIYGIITNLIIGTLKLIIGLFSNSISIIADAINNLLDMVSSILTLIGFKLSNKKPDKEHPFGHARYEYVAGLFVAFLMIIMGIYLLKESIYKIFYPEKLEINIMIYISLVISIIIKISQMKIYLDFSKEVNSSTLKTTAIDTRNDILSTLVILLSMVIMDIFKINIDGYLGTIMSIVVLLSSFSVLKEVLNPIIGIPPSKEYMDEISKLILSYQGIEGIHDLIIHNYGVNNNFVTVHVEMDANLSLIGAHNIVDKIEREFKNKDIDLTIHIDPIMVDDFKTKKLKEQIEKILLFKDENITIHDFRIIIKEKLTQIFFDCVVPYENEYTEEEIIDHLKKNIIDNYEFIIKIDKPYGK